jgi:hypothetical protein
MQENNNKIIISVLILVSCVLGYFTYSLDKQVTALEKQVKDMAPIVVEAYNGQNYLGKVLYEVGMLDKNADGTGVIINPALPLRSAQQAGVTPQ